MAGLDGLRALAVLAVIAYHLNLNFAPGGLLGVGVFFVLSGYLITDILVSEWRQSGRIDLKDFWLRRARRLLPGLFFMIVIVVAWITLFDHPLLSKIRGDVLAAVLYVSNWWLIFHHVSYFASFGPPSPLGHLWSLAVEEQFYLFWPLLLILGLRLVPRRGPLVGLTVMLAAASALLMALIYQPGTDPSRVYYGTDTRSFALLIGAALALVWPSRKLSPAISPWARLTLDVVGGTGLFIILYMIWQTNEYEDFLYRGGLVVVSVATAMVVAMLAHPASRLSKILAWSPLRWLGVRSYGIYLWHYPVIVLTSPAVNTEGVDVTRAILQVAASIGLAAFSWQVVEDPIRRGAIGRRGADMRQRGSRQIRLRGSRWVASAGALVALGVSCFGMARPIPAATTSLTSGVTNISPNEPASPSHEHGSGQPDTSSTTEGNHPSGTDVAKTTPNGHGVNQGTTSPGTTGTGTQPSGQKGTQGGASKSAGASTQKSGRGVTAIGDSVMIDIAPYLQKLLPGIVIDAHIGRQMYEAPNVVSQLKSKGNLGKCVIVELGTNGPFTKNQLESLLGSLGNPQQIVLVNTRVPRPWQNVVNSTLADVAASHPNITLVDWYGASAGHDAFFYPDGVHLNPEGSKFYASLVAKAVKPIGSPSGSLNGPKK
jgi:peptidoglycan/LPS O-acetylase OafA/YrhL